MGLFDELKELGVNVDEGIARVAGNAGLYQRMLAKLAIMIKEFSSTIDFEQDDSSELIEKVHALKGSAGNLSVTPLYNAYTRLMTLLSANEREQATAAYEEILPLQDKILACIERHA